MLSQLLEGLGEQPRKLGEIEKKLVETELKNAETRREFIDTLLGLLSNEQLFGLFSVLDGDGKIELSRLSPDNLYIESEKFQAIGFDSTFYSGAFPISHSFLIHRRKSDGNITIFYYYSGDSHREDKIQRAARRLSSEFEGTRKERYYINFLQMVPEAEVSIEELCNKGAPPSRYSAFTRFYEGLNNTTSMAIRRYERKVTVLAERREEVEVNTTELQRRIDALRILSGSYRA